MTHCADDIRALLPLITEYGFDYAINQEFASAIKQLTDIDIDSSKIYSGSIEQQQDQSIMLCCGGDGTLLEGIHRLNDKTIPVAAINFGHLGFLSSATRNDIKDLFDDIAAGTLHIQPRTMLMVEGLDQGPVTALNEVTAHRLEATMIKVEAQVGGQTVAHYNGDGVIVSTPTGSTAYSLSAGGPIVAPDCSCILLTPLAPHNFGMRPLVVPDTVEIELHIRTRHGSAMLSVDNRTYRIEDGCRVKIRQAEETILLASPHNISFYETLHNKMMWDVDIRN